MGKTNWLCWRLCRGLVRGAGFETRPCSLLRVHSSPGVGGTEVSNSSFCSAEASLVLLPSQDGRPKGCEGRCLEQRAPAVGQQQSRGANPGVSGSTTHQLPPKCTDTSVLKHTRLQTHTGCPTCLLWRQKTSRPQYKACSRLRPWAKQGTHSSLTKTLPSKGLPREAARTKLH